MRNPIAKAVRLMRQQIVPDKKKKYVQEYKYVSIGHFWCKCGYHYYGESPEDFMENKCPDALK